MYTVKPTVSGQEGRGAKVYRRADWKFGLQNKYGRHPAHAVYQQAVPSDHDYDNAQ